MHVHTCGIQYNALRCVFCIAWPRLHSFLALDSVAKCSGSIRVSAWRKRGQFELNRLRPMTSGRLAGRCKRRTCGVHQRQREVNLVESGRDEFAQHGIPLPCPRPQRWHAQRAHAYSMRGQQDSRKKGHGRREVRRPLHTGAYVSYVPTAFSGVCIHSVDSLSLYKPKRSCAN